MRDWLTKDFWWKLFSVVLAIAVWVTVHKYQEPFRPGLPAGVETTYNDLPVTIVSATANVHDFRVAPGSVSVTVSGSKMTMGILQKNQVHAFVDLSSSDLSAKDLHSNVQISTPPGVTLINIDPQRVAIIPPPPKQQ